MGAWHNDEAFWTAFQPFLFPSEKVENASEEVTNIRELVSLDTNAQVLDLACGPGRHSLAFARQGFDVTGVDITEQYLRQARERAEKHGFDIEFVQADMREFVRKSTFDLIINLFTSFGYFDDQDDDRQVVRNIHRSLTPGGSFVIQTLGKEKFAQDFQQKTWTETADGYVMEEWNVTDGWNRVESRWIAVKDGETKEFNSCLRLYSAKELTTLLEEEGFSETDVYGNLSGEPYDEDAKSLVIVARK